MTNEEAIRILEGRSNLFRKFQHIKESESVEISNTELNFPALLADQYRKVADACDLAINALSNRPTGEPLTLEQLRDMLENDGEIIGAAVIVSEDGVLSHAVIDSRVEDGICASTGVSGEWLKEKDYGKDWIAYAYPPAHIDLGCGKDRNVPTNTVHIDREAWTAEWRELHGDKMVGLDDCGEDVYRHYHYSVCTSCGKGTAVKSNFCPSCGRAMTPEAWAELEKRLRG